MISNAPTDECSFIIINRVCVTLPNSCWNILLHLNVCVKEAVKQRNNNSKINSGQNKREQKIWKLENF